MLSAEKQEVINGCVVYQDYTNAKSFYCLPEETAKIADNGRAIQYVVYTDHEVLEGDSPDFDNDESRVGGFLTVQVELGPTEQKLESIRDELKSKYGDDIKLSMVPFQDGNVKLVLFGSDGSDTTNTEDFKIMIAGSTKPSLQLRQTAVFSTRLSNTPAQIMWNLLKEGSQTQASVVYDLSYAGLQPNYSLEITVDFKATENFWNHTFDLKAGVKSDDVNVMASANVDVMIRELVNEGSIVVKKIDYSTGEAHPELLGNDPTGIELVKKLMATTLFEPTAIPSDTATAAVNEAITNRASRRSDEEDAGRPGPGDDPEPDPNPEPGPDPDDREDPEPDPTPDPEPNPPTPDPEPDPNPDPEPEPDPGPEPDPTPDPDPEPDPDADPDPDPTPDPGPEPNPEDPPTPGDDEDDRPTTDDEDEDAEDDETSSELGVDIEVGYTLRRREISQQVKRKFVFNEIKAKTIKYYPNGALTVEGTAFDVNKQVQLVRLNEGPFKVIELDIRASFDFDEYDIRETIVHISYGYKGAQGDRSNRLHELSVTLDKTKTSDKRKFFVDEYGTLSYDYQVEFIHNTGSIVGSPETKVTSPVFEDETHRDLSINMDKHSPLIPVEIQAGELQFEDDGIRSVQVFLAPTKDGNGKTTILNATNSELKRYLIHPPEKNQYDYFLRQEFFFKDEKLVFEEENNKDSQIIVDRPVARIFSISPNLMNSHNLVQQALVDIKYTAADADVKNTTLNLTPTEPVKSFSVLVEENDPRTWSGRTRFVLTDGRLLEGQFINYDMEQPLINLDNSGFRTIKVVPLMGAATFNGKIAALEVTLSSIDPERTESTVLFLNQGKPEDIAIIPNMPASQALNATVKIFANDGTQEEQTFVVPPRSPQLMLPITAIN